MIGGLLGRKVGMTQLFAEDGTVVPVTVIQAGPCQVMQIKTSRRDGYEAVQLGLDDIKRKNATKPASGHARVAQAEPKRFMRELPVSETEGLELGQAVTVEIFKDVRAVDVTGITKGKGFQGVIKRHGFRGQRASHGASKVHRAPGAIGQCADPSRVFKGTRMPGQMGHARMTVRNLRVVNLDTDRNLLLVRGCVPGPNGGYLIVRPGRLGKVQQP